MEETWYHASIFYHMPPTDRWPNRGSKPYTLSAIEATVGKNLRNWLSCLPFIEFAYNHAKHSITNQSPFEVVYGFNPEIPLDFKPLTPDMQVSQSGASSAEFVKTMHQ